MGWLSRTYHVVGAILLVMFFLADAHAQEPQDENGGSMARALRKRNSLAGTDSILAISSNDTLLVDTVVLNVRGDSVECGDEVVLNADSSDLHITFTEDSLRQYINPLLCGRFVPDPKKALWLAMVIPGGGQIYNRKYWKLPLIYGGFIGCVYAMTWNNTMYRDYSQAYIDIMDSDENTKSYEKFLPVKYDVVANKTRLQDLFKRKKNYYRRYRDLSMFCMIGVYALSIIDAYVDAEMSSFDISRDLSLKVRPAVIRDKGGAMPAQGMAGSAYGLGCCLNF